MQLLRWAALRSVRRRSVPRRRTHIRTVAIIPTRLAIEGCSNVAHGQEHRACPAGIARFRDDCARFNLEAGLVKPNLVAPTQN